MPTNGTTAAIAARIRPPWLDIIVLLPRPNSPDWPFGRTSIHPFADNLSHPKWVFPRGVGLAKTERGWGSRTPRAAERRPHLAPKAERCVATSCHASTLSRGSVEG